MTRRFAIVLLILTLSLHVCAIEGNNGFPYGYMDQLKKREFALRRRTASINGEKGDLLATLIRKLKNIKKYMVARKEIVCQANCGTVW